MSNPFLAVFVWYIAASTLAFLLFWQDKNAAISGRWRTAERTLLVVSLAGGWPGSFAGRKVFRHKTRKPGFGAALLVMSIMNIAGVAYLSTSHPTLLAMF